MAIKRRHGTRGKNVHLSFEYVLLLDVIFPFKIPSF